MQDPQIQRLSRPRLIIVGRSLDTRSARELRRQGFVMAFCRTGARALQRLSESPVDLVLVHWDLPAIDGASFCRALRRQGRSTGIPVLAIAPASHRGGPASCLDEGADDALLRPFSARHLLARIRALLRRPRIYSSGDAVIEHGPMRIDIASHRVLWSGKPVEKLTPKEFGLLRELVLRAPRVVDKETLALSVWGVPQKDLHYRTLDVHVQRLRRKLGAKGELLLRTVTAVGFQWDCEDRFEKSIDDTASLK